MNPPARLLRHSRPRSNIRLPPSDARTKDIAVMETPRSSLIGAFQNLKSLDRLSRSHLRLQLQRIFHRRPSHWVILEAGLAHHVSVKTVSAVEDDRLIHRGGDLAERERCILRP